jgi:hypothetical protein
MLLIILGILDIIIGIAVAVSTGIPLVASGVILTLGVIALLKGLYSVGTAAGAGFYFDVLGWLDLIACIFLFMSYWGWVFGFFLYAGILIVLKGLYSFAMGASS